MGRGRKYWLVKTEPSSYSIEDLAAEPNQTTHWHGVRNYQARNFMRDEMRVNDEVLIYHSNAKPPAVVGVGRVVREAYPDDSAFDPSSPYHDDASTPDEPRWFMVDLQLVERFADPIPLETLRGEKKLEGMELLRKGSRLSVQPVLPTHFRWILKLAHRASK
jgi:predicted RNA-binding protein with PUA-like domain